MFKLELFKNNVPLSNNIYQKISSLFSWIYIRISKQNLYVTERYRPILINKINENLLDKTSDVAIMLRGQIVKIDNFTKNTIRMYRLKFPNAPIYLSTWDYCMDSDFFLFAKKNNVNLVLTKFKKPISGYKNDNLQIILNERGLESIIKDKIKYSISTRTDQRFYIDKILIYLKNILSVHNYKKKSIYDNQINRLIAMSFDTFFYRLYGLGDQFLFGLTKDVLNYWSSEKDSRIFCEEDFKKSMSLRCLAKLRHSEVYFMTEFLKRNGHNISWDLRDYFEVLKERFIILDSQSLDFFWPKYSFFEERFKDWEDIRFKEVSHLDWLLIKNDKIEYDEKVLDLIF